VQGSAFERPEHQHLEQPVQRFHMMTVYIKSVFISTEKHPIITASCRSLPAHASVRTKSPPKLVKAVRLRSPVLLASCGEISP
jgi:hypothetical protein